MCHRKGGSTTKRGAGPKRKAFPAAVNKPRCTIIRSRVYKIHGRRSSSRCISKIHPSFLGTPKMSSIKDALSQYSRSCAYVYATSPHLRKFYRALFTSRIKLCHHPSRAFINQPMQIKGAPSPKTGTALAIILGLKRSNTRDSTC